VGCHIVSCWLVSEWKGLSMVPNAVILIMVGHQIWIYHTKKKRVWEQKALQFHSQVQFIVTKLTHKSQSANCNEKRRRRKSNILADIVQPAVQSTSSMLMFRNKICILGFQISYHLSLIYSAAFLLFIWMYSRNNISRKTLYMNIIKIDYFSKNNISIWARLLHTGRIQIQAKAWSKQTITSST
jgi:hypothetical protein